MAKRIKEGSWAKAFLWAVIGAGLGFLLGWLFFARPVEAKGEPTPPPLPKVTICHKPGTPAEKTKRVPITAVPGHLGHGDYLGPCRKPTPTPTPEPEQYPVCHCEYQETLVKDDNGELSCETLWGSEQFVKRHLNAHKKDYKGECRKPEPTPTPEPEQCDLTFGCEACQNDPNEHRKRLGICYEDFIAQCSDKYGCGWVLDCPENGHETLRPQVCKRVWQCKDTCEVPEPTPTPEPTPEPQPEERGTTEAGAPQCTDGTPAKVPANPHVIRNGSQATVNAHIPEGDTVHVYFKENDADGWVHAARDIPVVDNYVSYTINDLDPNVGYTFGIQSANGCAGGETVLAVIIDPPADGEVFTLSFWEWLF
jgi:hypothetical protein